MQNELDERFYDRADEIINRANEQLDFVNPGKVSASLLYAAARYNAYVSSLGFASGREMASQRSATIRYFVREYRKMLEDNLDDYVAHFEERYGSHH